MRKLGLIVCSLCLLAFGAQAQGKVASQWKCGRDTIAHNIDVGDQAGHSYGVIQSKCDATKGELEGVKEKEGTGTEFSEATGNNLKWHGVFVETLASGDKVYYNYEGTGTMRNKQYVTGSHKWTITNGTGKFKGAKGEGTCKGKGNADGSAEWACEGTIQLAGGAAAKAPAKK